MGRPSAANDAALWLESVRDWCEGKWGVPRARAKSGLKSRFLFELDIYIELAKRGSTAHAKAIIVYFYFTSRSGKTVDSRVLQFLEEARQRYAADPKRRIQNALLLSRARRGNPGGAHGRHELTPEARIEAA